MDLSHFLMFLFILQNSCDKATTNRFSLTKMHTNRQKNQTIAQSQHEKKGHEETWVEMAITTWNRSTKDCRFIASSSNNNQRQPLEYPLFLSRMSQANRA